MNRLMGFLTDIVFGIFSLLALIPCAALGSVLFIAIMAGIIIFTCSVLSMFF